MIQILNSLERSNLNNLNLFGVWKLELEAYCLDFFLNFRYYGFQGIGNI